MPIIYHINTVISGRGQHGQDWALATAVAMIGRGHDQLWPWPALADNVILHHNWHHKMNSHRHGDSISSPWRQSVSCRDELSSCACSASLVQDHLYHHTQRTTSITSKTMSNDTITAEQLHRPWKDKRLSWPRWLVIPRWFTQRRSHIQVLTGPDIE